MLDLNIGDKLHDGEQEYRIIVMYPDLEQVDIMSSRGHTETIGMDLVEKMLVR